MASNLLRPLLRKLEGSSSTPGRTGLAGSQAAKEKVNDLLPDT